MEEKDQIGTYKDKRDRVLSILGIGNRKDKLDASMDTTLEELKKLWNDSTDYTDSIVGSIGSSDETPQPKVPTNPKLTIEGLHNLEGNYRKGVITDTLFNEYHYIVELHTHSLIPIEATIFRTPVEFGKIRIDIRESGKASVQYHTQREGFRNRKDFATELFALADDYIEGEYYK